jgi:type IV fimbrial biogenesis protein FimT
MRSDQHPLNAAYLAQRGFTLIEMMVTVAVMAILLSLAAPSFNDALLGNKLSSYANDIVASAIVARSEAIKRNAAVTMCVSTDGTTCAAAGGWEQGWIVRCSTSDNATCDSAGTSTIVMQRRQAAASGFKISDAGGLSSLTFQPTGVGATSGTLTVCRATPRAGGQERVVDITATGRASVRKTTAGVCT